MKRVTAFVSGSVQRAGYRSKVVDIAIAFGLKGLVQNLNDGRVKVTAEGDEADLARSIRALDIKNALIHVSSIESSYSPATGEYDGFNKLVGRGETDSRLDVAVGQLKGVKESIDRMNSNLGVKMDKMIEKQDELLVEVKSLNDKQDRTLEKQDELLVEVKSLNDKQDRTLEKQDELLVEVKSLNDKADMVVKKQDDLAVVKADITDIRIALKAKGIM